MNENKKKLENTLDFYNEKMTKQAVGRLFQEYMDEGEENYFISEKKYNKDNLSEENPRASRKSYYDEFENRGYQNQYYNSSNDKYYRDSPEHYYEDYGGNYNNIPSDYDSVRIYSSRRKRNSRGRGSQKPKSENNIKRAQNTRPKKPKKRSVRDIYYEDNYYDEKKSGKFFTVILGIFSAILLVIVTYLSYKLNVVNAELETVSDRLDNELANPSNTEELNSLKAEVESLTKENEELKGSKAGKASQQNGESSDSDESSGEDDETDTASGEIPSSYTVEKGDNAWNISQKVYGKGDYYQKILEANNLENADALFVGQVLDIPQI